MSETQEMIDTALDAREAAAGHAPAAAPDDDGVGAEMLLGELPGEQPNEQPEQAPERGEATKGDDGAGDDLQEVLPEDDQTAAADDDAAADDAGGDDEGQADQPKRGWDKGRQRADQAIATLTKQVSALTQLVTKLTRGGSPDGQPPAEQPTDQELADLVELDEFATEDDRRAAVNALIQRQRAAEQSQRVQANRGAFLSILDEMDSQYGKHHRNAAVAAVREAWNKAGFDEKHYPDAATTRLAVEGAYARLALAAAKAGQPQPKGAKRSPASAPAGAGSRVAARPSGMETLDDAFAAMKREGKFAKRSA